MSDSVPTPEWLACQQVERAERQAAALAAMSASNFSDPEPIPTPYVPGTYYPRQWRQVVRDVESEPSTFAYGDVTDVIGNYPRVVTELPDGRQSIDWAEPNGRPVGWGTLAPDPRALPRTNTRVVRSRKGRTSFVKIGRRPVHRTTVGDLGYRDPVLDRMAWLTECDASPSDPHPDGCQCALTDDRLARAADAWANLVTRGRSPVPRLIGEQTARPTGVYGDRSLPDLTTVDESDYVHQGPRSIDGRRFVESVAVRRVRNGRRSRQVVDYKVLDMPADMPAPHAVSLCEHRNAGSWHRETDTSVRDLQRARTTIARRNRLPVCVHSHVKTCTAETRRESPCQCRPVGCTCGLDREGLAIVGTWIDDNGRERQAIGRRTATATELVTFADSGYWLGHRYVPSDAERSTRASTERASIVAAAIDHLSIVLALPIGASTPDGIVSHPRGSRWMVNGLGRSTPATAAIAYERALAATS